jgi:ribosome-binding ATPase YchF (GTP1/OBG family)
MQIGIIGLPNSTKTTIFNALTKSEVETAAYSSGQIEVHTATVRVPDPRIDRLAAMFNPRKTTYAQIEYNDIAGLLDLHSFFTVGEDKVRSWTIPVGATALEAAGAIHSDLARGFIRAEVVSYDDLIVAGSLDAARKQGVFRLQGRDYVVQDGDILNIRFNV